MIICSCLDGQTYKVLMRTYHLLKSEDDASIAEELYDDLLDEFMATDVWVLHEAAWHGFLVLLRVGDGLLLNPYFFGAVPMVETGYDYLADELMKEALIIFRKTTCNRLYAVMTDSHYTPEKNDFLINHGIRFDYKYEDMLCNIPACVLKPQAPKGIVLKHVSEYSNSVLKECFDRVFCLSDVKYYLNLTDREKETFFDDVVYEGVREHPCSLALVYDGRLIGYSLVFNYHEQPYITCMCIDQAYRGKGYGRYLLESISYLASQAGNSSIGLGTEYQMKAFGLYESHGYRAINGKHYYISKK